MTFTFNLIDQPWIPVDRDGGRHKVSLATALAESAAIAGLAFPAPTEMVAVLRQVLLPVVLDALEPPRDEDDWMDRFERGSPPTEGLLAYLDAHRDRFDLFDPVVPFAQVGGATASNGETKPSSLLLPAIASGNNVPLFSSWLEDQAPSLTPPEAAAALLATHCWDTAAIKSGLVGDPRVKGGKTTGNPTGPVGQLGVVIPSGRNLWETILLNLPIIPDGNAHGDRPQWRGDPATVEWTERPAGGLLDLLTWQSRRIRLFSETDERGATVVRRVLVGAGDRLATTPGLEPHTLWTRTSRPRAGQPPRRPRRHRAGRATWLGVDMVLAAGPIEDGVETTGLLTQLAGLTVDADGVPDDYPLRVTAVGMVYGNQSAVVEHVIHDQIPLPVVALRRSPPIRDAVHELAGTASEVAKALDMLEADLRQAAGGEAVPWDRGARPEVPFLHALDLPARRRLRDLAAAAPDVEGILTGWHVELWDVATGLAGTLLDATTPQAFAGRPVTRGSRAVMVRTSTASRAFRGRLRQILFRVTDASSGPTQAGA